MPLRSVPAARRDARGTWFEVKRTKTGAGAIATLTHRVERLLDWYWDHLDLRPATITPLFLNRSGDPYSKDTLGDDFRAVREAEFGPAEKRQLKDIRRSGSVEAVAGRADPGAMSKKMGNTIGTSNRLHQVYVPAQVSIVRDVDAARAVGHRKLKERE